MDSSQRFKARIIFFLVAAGGAVLASALYWTQIVKGETYATKANIQYAKDNTYVFDRGAIYFHAKDGTKTTAAGIAHGYTIYMNPSVLTNKESAYEALSHYIDIDKNEFMKKAAKTNLKYEVLAKKVDDATAKAIGGLGLKGIGMNEESWRSYPGNKLAAHAIGLVGESTSSGVEGRYGLEKTYEDILSRVGSDSSVNVFAEIFAGIKESVFGGGPVKGDVVTSLEPSVQGFIEKTLGEVDKTWSPERVGAIVMDPNTGEIIAMAALPDYDPNNLTRVKDAGIFSNPMVEHVYEMGSIMKPLTMAAGLDSGVIKPTSTYDDTGTITLSGKKIANFDGKARGVVPMQEILSQSLNVGVAHIALKMGKESFAKYFTSFGIGDKTGIDQPSEGAGLVSNLKTGRDIEIATASYGQGIAISPIAMTRALAVLANGGHVIQPHLATEIEYEDGTTKKLVYPEGAQVIRKDTAESVTNMLVKVVDEALKKGALKMDRFSIAAKTGTAQIANPNGGGYYDDRYLHSFFGYFPAYNPKFIVFLFQVHPKGAQYASETLADPFSEIAKFLIHYYNIPPDR